MNGRSVGKIIEDKRKELGLTIEECSKKTRISKKFLEAIESDNYDAFPGEVYYLGFLRNYAQLLSLDANKLIHDYHKQKKIEEPAPIEELTKPLKKEIKFPNIGKNVIPIVIISLILLTIIIGIIIISNLPKKEKVEISSNEIKNKTLKNENEFILNQRKIVKTFLPNQIIVIPDGDYRFKIKITSLDKESKTAQINIADLINAFELKEKDQIKFDFNENNEYDLQILVNQIDSSGIVLTIERLTLEKGSGQISEKNFVVLTSSESQGKQESTANSVSPNVISVVIQAKRNGYVRFESDTEGTVEKFLNVGDSLKIGGSKQVIIQITNANYMDVIINNNPVDLPNDYVVYCIVKWVYDQQLDKYNLVTEFKK